MRHTTMSAVVFTVLMLLTTASVAAAYDVEKELEVLKMLYGDNPMSIFGNDPYCDPILGCFEMDGAFAERTINFKPHSREVINTTFTMYTRGNRLKGHILKADNVSTITNSLFNGNHSIKVIVHGYIENSTPFWMKEMNEELLTREDMNVIDVGWGGLGASKTLYEQATANIRVVAREIVYLLKTLKELKGLDYNDVHLIGHSLGAHCVAYVGKNLTNLIGRITGLDPADPYFQGHSAAIRLAQSDAKFVDVIHSDSDSILENFEGKIGGFGTKDLCGHADFFPNGGSLQPECEHGIMKTLKEKDSLLGGLHKMIFCSHQRSVKYFTESINNCNFTGVLCSDYNEFKNGKCSLDCNSSAEHCNMMGYHAHKPTTDGYKKYYLYTMGDDLDFCATGYQIKVTFADHSATLHGSLKFNIHGKNGITQTLRINQDDKPIAGGETRIYTAGVASAINELTKLDVMPIPEKTWFDTLYWSCQLFGFCPAAIDIAQVELASANRERNYFCGTGHSYKYEVSYPMYHNKSQCTTTDSSCFTHPYL